MKNGSKTARRITLRTLVGSVSVRPVDRYSKEITQGLHDADMALFREKGRTVHAWSGEDRNGSPLTVEWLSRSLYGIPHLDAYEISGGE